MTVKRSEKTLMYLPSKIVLVQNIASVDEEFHKSFIGTASLVASKMQPIKKIEKYIISVDCVFSNSTFM